MRTLVKKLFKGNVFDLILFFTAENPISSTTTKTS